MKLEIKINQRLSLCSLQWDYNRELARLGNLKPLPDATENLYMAVRIEKCPFSETIENGYRFIKEGKLIWWPTKRTLG